MVYCKWCGCKHLSPSSQPDDSHSLSSNPPSDVPSIARASLLETFAEKPDPLSGTCCEVFASLASLHLILARFTVRAAQEGVDAFINKLS